MTLAQNMEVKEQIREATDIVDLVGSYLPLQRQGRLFKALCPWHDDTRPSLQVNPDRQSYKCWVCDVGGDVFSFVMKMEGLEFPDALKMLAERAGIDLAQKTQGRVAIAGSDKELLFRVNAWAEEQYHRFLLEAEAANVARTYLNERDISESSWRKFRLGFSPPGEWDWILRRARSTEFSTSVLERAGLIIPRAQSDGHYDRFRGRLLFSIRDARGRTIAFGGRVLPGLARDDDPKYINSPETPLFSKSRELYSLDAAKESIARERQVVVVEGYTDCIMAHQHGVHHVVAVLGTALTELHIPLLRRFADSVTLVLDGDEAGRKRSSEVLDLFVAHQLDLRILTLPQGADPCDFISTQGSAAFRKLLGEAVDAFEHRIRMATDGMVASRETHRANRAIEEILATLARAQRPGTVTPAAWMLRQQQLLARLAREFRIPEKTLRERLVELRNTRQRSGTFQKSDGSSATQQAVPRSLPAWDREFLELLITAPQTLERLAAEVAPGDLQDPLARTIYERCLDLDRSGTKASLQALLLVCDDVATKNILVRLDEEGRAKQQSDLTRRITDLVRSMRKRRDEDQVRSQLANLTDGNLSQQQQEETLSSLFDRFRSRQVGSTPKDG